MASNHDVFEEHVGVIAALRENYSGTDDGMMIQAIHDVYDHIKDLRIQREGHVKDIIRELTQHVERDEAEAKYPREEGEHEREMEDLRREKEGAQKEVGSLEAQMEALETQKKDVERQMEALDGVWKKLVAMEKVEEPYQRNKMALYAHVSKVEWDLKHINKIKGTIDNPDYNVLKDFDLGEGMATTESVNALWDMIQGR